MNILFQLSGSIACYKACMVISRLAQGGHAVQCVATENALRFIGPATLEGLSGRPLLTDTFAPGRWMEHIELSRWADVTILCPATANRLNAMAAGLAGDLVGNLWLAHDFTRPFLVAPAMNTTMWNHPTTQAAREKLAAMGVIVIAPESGNLACGEVGDGRLAEPETILAALLAARTA